MEPYSPDSVDGTGIGLGSSPGFTVNAKGDKLLL